MDNRDKLGILFTFARHEQFFDALSMMAYHH